MSGSKDRGVQFWDPQSGNTQLMLQGHKNSGMSFHSLDAMTLDRVVCSARWYVSRLGKQRLIRLPCLLNIVISVAPSPFGGLFATGSGDMRARIWRSVNLSIIFRTFLP